MRWRVAVILALGGACLLPASAWAASVTLTSPADGAKFYAGASGSIADAAPLLASRDVSGCLANQDTAYWRVYSTDSQGRTSIVAQSTGPTINIQRLWLFGVGVYQIYGEFICGHADGTTTPIRSDVHTISVLRENPPAGGGGGGGSDPGAAAKAAFCASQKARITEIGNIAKEVGEGEGVERMENLSETLWVISQILEPAGEKLVESENPVAAAYGTSALFVAVSYDTLSNITDVAVADTKRTARQIVHDSYTPLTGDFYTDCGEALLAIDISPPSIKTQLATFIKYLAGKAGRVSAVAARKSRRGSALGKKFKANAKAFKAAVKAYNRAQSALAKHLTDPPPAEVNAVKAAASRLITLIRQQGKLRNSLPRAIKRIKARKRYFPKKLRSNAAVKAIDGMSVGEIIKRTKLAKNEQDLIAYLRRQPVLPSH
jgi:hypothetical protein